MEKLENTQNKITIRHGFNIDPLLNSPASKNFIALTERHCIDCVLEDVRKYVETIITENPREIIASITILSDKPVPTLRNKQ